MLELARVSFKDLSDKTILARLNEALIDWCDQTDYLVTSATIAAGTTFPANLPTGLKRVADEGVIMYETNGVPSDKSVQIYEALVDADLLKYRLFDRQDRQYITEIASDFDRTLKLFYIKSPTALSDTNDTALDTAPEIPSQFHTALVYRALEPYYFAESATNGVAMGRFCREAWEDAVRLGRRMARMESSRRLEQYIPEMEL